MRCIEKTYRIKEGIRYMASFQLAVAKLVLALYKAMLCTTSLQNLW